MQECKHFEAETYELHVCTELLPSTCDIQDETDLFNALKLLKKEKLPLYRFNNFSGVFSQFFVNRCYITKFPVCRV